MVPNGWKAITLGDLVTSSAFGPRFSSDLYSKNGAIGTIRTTDLCDEGTINYNTIPYADLDIDEFKSHILVSGDLLITRSGTCGIPCIFEKQDKPIIAGAFLIRFKLKSDVDASYLHYLLKYDVTQHHISKMASGGVQKNLTGTSLKKLKLEVPEHKEQRKISKILSIWDKAISTTEQLIDNSKQQKKALMQQLLTGKKRLLDDSGKSFEGEYERVNLSELATLDKISLGKKTPENFEFSYISLSDVETGKISKKLEKHVYASSPSRARRVVSDGDILLATVRPNLKGFAKVTEEHDGMIASTGFSVLTPKKDVSGDYLYHYLFSCHITSQINALVVGSNYPAINSSDISGLKVYIPCYDEQKKLRKF
ncbi:restriction endonuclease subunit S [Psychrosphaera algicola]|uniref:Restriction endonuclease subunit S n=1 Tax=Psychrosphaera algicola TaxID=3023714 RepID=A0ABT5FGJ9_9GAMM|nr:restriction endonuclease subunit S [Psychrosphaera sp. G1-22]MDC2890374.1 restriction endonuclease subunit S [Psychrosphaera sp. G1-22]